jgi:hypothetical protein
MPALELVHLPANGDDALGFLVERLSKSPFWRDSVLVAIVGVDAAAPARPGTALLAGAHVRRGVQVSSVYTVPSVLRMIELALGIPPLGQQDAVARSMSELFGETPNLTPFEAAASSPLDHEKPIARGGGCTSVAPTQISAKEGAD